MVKTMTALLICFNFSRIEQVKNMITVFEIKDTSCCLTEALPRIPNFLLVLTKID